MRNHKRCYFIKTAAQWPWKLEAAKKELTYLLGVVLDKMNRKEEAMEQFKLIYETDIGYRDVSARVDAYYASGGQ